MGERRRSSKGDNRQDRRCGKSSLLRMFRENFSSDGVSEEQVQNLKLRVILNEPFLNYKFLCKRARKSITWCPDKMNYLFFDEIQMVGNFQKVIDSLFLLDNVDIYVTGSNAYLLSGEIATCSPEDTFENQALPFLLPRIDTDAACSILPESSPIANTSNSGSCSQTFPK